MDGFQLVAQVGEVPSGTGKVVRVNGRDLALFNVEGRFYAISNTCPHEGGPLAEGRLKGCVVSCPWHDLAFDVRSGHGTDGGGYSVGSYEVRV
ncbi:MAG: Rieske 2Fe-2S domain-containing protein, partial [Actinobacteria bacterium]|nr:Rieske 2Fe-2S domain-containing protein [Actinomycetota bacterium]